MKNWIIVLVIAIIVVAGGLYMINSSDSEDETTNNSTSPQASVEQSDQQSKPESSPEATSEMGSYIEYSNANVDKYAGKTKVVFFHADWCPNCRALENNLQAGAIPDDIVILKADFDRDSELKDKYGVRSQTTLVQIDDDGNKVKLWIGTAFDDIDSIQEEII